LPAHTPTLSLHDALPIFVARRDARRGDGSHFESAVPASGSAAAGPCGAGVDLSLWGATKRTRTTRFEGGREPRRCADRAPRPCRSEEHTSELQSRVDLVC